MLATEILNVTEAIVCESTLFEHAKLLARTLGFEHCSYHFKAPFPITRPAIVGFFDYPDSWGKVCKAKGYCTHNPVRNLGLSTSLPFFWHEQLFEDTPGFWSDINEHGLRHGWSIPSRAVNGTSAVWSLSRSAEPITKAEVAEKQGELMWLSQLIHTCMSRILSPKLHSKIDIKLTEREKEVLRWTAEGKTSFEISRILKVAERTVNFHVNNAVLKLGASNKTQAAVQAALSGAL